MLRLEIPLLVWIEDHEIHFTHYDFADDLSESELIFIHRAVSVSAGNNRLEYVPSISTLSGILRPKKGLRTGTFGALSSKTPLSSYAQVTGFQKTPIKKAVRLSTYSTRMDPQYGSGVHNFRMFPDKRFDCHGHNKETFICISQKVRSFKPNGEYSHYSWEYKGHAIIQGPVRPAWI